MNIKIYLNIIIIIILNSKINISRYSKLKKLREYNFILKLIFIINSKCKPPLLSVPKYY